MYFYDTVQPLNDYYPCRLKESWLRMKRDSEESIDDDQNNYNKSDAT